MTNKNALDAVRRMYYHKYGQDECAYDDLIIVETALSQPANKIMLAALIEAKLKLEYLWSRANDREYHGGKPYQFVMSDIDNAIAASSAPVVEVEGLEEALQREDGEDWTLMFVGIGKNIKAEFDCRKDAVAQVMAIVQAARLQLARQKGGA